MDQEQNAAVPRRAEEEKYNGALHTCTGPDRTHRQPYDKKKYAPWQMRFTSRLWRSLTSEDTNVVSRDYGHYLMVGHLCYRVQYFPVPMVPLLTNCRTTTRSPAVRYEYHGLARL